MRGGVKFGRFMGGGVKFENGSKAVSALSFIFTVSVLNSSLAYVAVNRAQWFFCFFFFIIFYYLFFYLPLLRYVLV